RRPSLRCRRHADRLPRRGRWAEDPAPYGAFPHFNGRILREFERATGYAVAYDGLLRPRANSFADRGALRRRRAPRAGPRPRHRGGTIAQGWEAEIPNARISSP